MLNIAIKAARSAGNFINRASLDLDMIRVSTKAPNDFVTEVDQKAEEHIIDMLLSAYPSHGILAEESGSTHGAQNSEFVWIIDPLDGTTNFIHGFPVYAVSIALAVRGQVQQAVVYDPTRNDLFFASKGQGAFLNDKRLRVSRRVRLSDCLISTGFPFRQGDNFKRYLKMLEAVMPHCAGLRRPGSAALDLCYVAAGYTDGYFETGLSPWDIAAGSLIVTEAGGLIGNFTGEPDFLYQREVLAGGPKIYGQLVGLLSPYTRILRSTHSATGEPAAGSASSGRPYLGSSTLTESIEGLGDASKPQRSPRHTPESALAAELNSTAADEPTPTVPVKKAPTRISKESMARERQTAADAERKNPNFVRRPRRDDAPF
jgi:myo-inositol-1(or 4)-monophosphatase